MDWKKPEDELPELPEEPTEKTAPKDLEHWEDPIEVYVSGDIIVVLKDGTLCVGTFEKDVRCENVEDHINYFFVLSSPKHGYDVINSNDVKAWTYVEKPNF